MGAATGIDKYFMIGMQNKVEKRKVILCCILDVIMYLTEHSLPFHGCNSTLGEAVIGLFLGTLGNYNTTLQEHLDSSVLLKHNLGERM